MQYYKQCKLMHSDDSGVTYQVAFIPRELAFNGSIIGIQEDLRPWLVVEVGATIDQETLDSHRKAWKRWSEVLT